MRVTTWWAVVDKDGNLLTVANMPRVFFDRKDAADDAWRHYHDARVVKVEIRTYDRVPDVVTDIKGELDEIREYNDSL